jgi:carbamate kinase
VQCVYTHWRTPAPRAVRKVTASELRGLIREGHFPDGSMGPKVEAAARFASRPGRRAIITNPSSLADALAGDAGTEVIPDPEQPT